MRKRSSNPSEDSDDGAKFSTSLVRGLHILRAFRSSDVSLGNLDIMERTGLAKATVSRLTYTLAGLGYLVYNETLGRYTLGAATVSLGYTALSSSALVHNSGAAMQALADETGAAIALASRDRNEMVYLSNCRSESLVTLRLNVGSRLPLWNSGMGLAYLVGLTDEQRQALKDRYLPKNSKERSVFLRLLDSAIEQYARVGYITSFGNWHSHVRAVGVPFRPTDGSPPVAFTCGGTSEIIDEGCVETMIGPAMVRLRNQVEAALTNPSPPLAAQE